MFQGFDFTQPGVMYFSQNRLKVMQEAYAGITQAMAGLLGDKVILTGVQVNNGAVSSGWVTYTDTLTGEMDILPLVGGSLAQFVDVQETVTTIPYNDGTSKPVLKKRELVLVPLQSGAAFPFSDLVRPGQYKNIWEPGDIKQVKCDASYIAANFDPVTGVANPNSERAGWKIDQAAGGRVIVGYHMSATNPGNDPAWNAFFNQPQYAGGEQLHQLTVAELPSHSHQQYWTIGSGGASGNNGTLVGGTRATSNTGNDQGHNNLQPYIVYLTLVKI